MIMRGLSTSGDWLFGKGRNDYVSGKSAVAQNIRTRLLSFLNDCFFDKGAGIDWFNLLGGKNQIAIDLAISATILNTPDVTGLERIYIDLSSSRNLTIEYKVETSFGTLASAFQYDLT